MKRSPAPPKKRPIKTKRRPPAKPVKRRLLVHVRHTGKLLPHSATSYPLLTFMVLLVGVLMAMCSSLAGASMSDEYVVHAVVPGIAPTNPGVITSPVDQTRFSNVPITVGGTCPTYAAYVKLYRNDFFSGAALCQAGAYSLQTDLFPGSNVLKVRVFNQADQEGPVSGTITVFYDVPVTAPIGTGTGGGAGSTNPTAGTGHVTGGSTGTTAPEPGIPVSISADYNYRGYNVGQEITWQFGITGGTQPYSIHTDWGDGTDTIQRQTKAGQLNLSHTYYKPVKDKVSYIIKISATDSDGNTTFMQIAVLITVPGTKGTGAIGTAGTGVIPPSSSHGVVATIIQYAWPTYGVSVVMLASFWLGEHREFNLLRNNIHAPKRLRHT